MAINKEHIKLFASQQLTDEIDGGGRATGNRVVDGQVSILREISRIDRTGGDGAMRKVFISVSTDNLDPFPSAHVILTEAPEDDRCGAVQRRLPDRSAP